MRTRLKRMMSDMEGIMEVNEDKTQKNDEWMSMKALGHPCRK